MKERLNVKMIIIKFKKRHFVLLGFLVFNVFSAIKLNFLVNKFSFHRESYQHVGHESPATFN